MALVSLIFIVAIIVLPMWFFQARRGRRHEYRQTTHVRGKWRKKLLAVYAGVLIIVMGVAIILPPFEASEGRTIEDEIRFDESLYEKVRTGEVEDVEGLSLAKQWDFPFEQQQLKMKVDYSGFYGLILFAAQKEAGEAVPTIEVDYYRTGTYIGSKDVTEHMTKPSVTLKDDTLVIMPPIPVKFEGMAIEKESITKQFNSKKAGNGIHDLGIMIGREVIIIHVPNNLEVFTGNDALEWIE